jgi:hypothetical protein
MVSRPWLLVFVVGLVVLLALMVGCSRDPGPRPAVELQVGERRISIVIPEGWEHLDYGERHQLRRGIARIAIEPVAGSPDEALRRLGEDERRDVAARTPLVIGDEEGVIVDTWDRLSHQHRKRFVFVPGEGRPLVIYTQLGEFEAMRADLDSLIASIAVADTTAGTVVGDQPQ